MSVSRRNSASSKNEGMPNMTEDWFLEHYWKLLSLQKAVGEVPEIQEIIDEGRAAGLDVDELIKRPSPPEIYLWL